MEPEVRHDIRGVVTRVTRVRSSVREVFNDGSGLTVIFVQE